MSISEENKEEVLTEDVEFTAKESDSGYRWIQCFGCEG